TGAVTLGSDVVLTTGGSTGQNISFSSTIDGSLANSQSLTLNTGASGTVSVTGIVGGTSLKTLTITNSGGTTFSSAVTTGTSAVLTATTGAIAFNGALTTPLLTVAAGAYNLSLLGTGTSITSAVTFNNTGTLTLGLGTSSQTFTGGFTATAPSTIYLAGTITGGDNISIGSSSHGISLNADTTIDTHSASKAITLGGAVTGNTHSLNLNAGTGAVSVAGMTGLSSFSTTTSGITLNGSITTTG
ncbi:hypothetical protein ICN47_12715, partial [Polynucleobacter sp. AP-Latsch-80-C2]|nr:hypothetical protein [Polynucleobacter sp. AP-Latsch-80-C2]